MLIRSKAPLRLGLAGGGTDTVPFSEWHGGAVLNATISMYAYASIRPRDDGKIVIHSLDNLADEVFESARQVPGEGVLALHKGVYNRIVRDYSLEPLSFDLYTGVDAPPGSGLGTSSTMVVAILGAFAEWLGLPLGEYDLAHLAYEIERIDLGIAGGKQDQYAATFGGVNFMEFSQDDKVIVNPLRIREQYLDELAHNLVLYHTETSRLSSRIIEQQTRNIKAGNQKSIEAMHRLKEQAVMMKETILRGDLDRIGQILDFGWRHKKELAEGITNSLIDEIYATALDHGATGGKISGAGGGGFMFFYCPGNTRSMVISSLEKFGGRAKRYEFTTRGLVTWTI